MTSQTSELVARLTRPIIGIENRSALEVFDIMCDRFRRLSSSEVTEEMIEAGAECLAGYDMDKMQRRGIAYDIYTEMRSAATSERKG